MCFWCDVLFQFNTGYYHADQGRWITDRKGISSRYLKLWFWLDMASLLPFGLMVQREDVSILRLIRLIRLFKLLRVAKAPRLLANIQVIATMSYKQKCVWKYLLVLCSMLHLMACAIRMAHDFQRGTKTHYETNSYLRWRVLESRRSSFRGNGALYVDSLDWAVSVMLGNSAYRTTAEGIISILGNLFGVMFVAFLFGDLTNILCNLDPAANEFKQTVDNLEPVRLRAAVPEGSEVGLARIFTTVGGVISVKIPPLATQSVVSQSAGVDCPFSTRPSGRAGALRHLCKAVHFRS